MSFQDFLIQYYGNRIKELTLENVGELSILNKILLLF
jgi:hypothetical protein